MGCVCIAMSDFVSQKLLRETCLLIVQCAFMYRQITSTREGYGRIVDSADTPGRGMLEFSFKDKLCVAKKLVLTSGGKPVY